MNPPAQYNENAGTLKCLKLMLGEFFGGKLLLMNRFVGISVASSMKPRIRMVQGNLPEDLKI